MSKVIDKFDGEYAFLSNFYDCPVEYDGLKYKNSEAAFHAQKTLNKEKRKEFTTLNPSEAKKLGRKLKLRDDWEEVKTDIMYEICLAKFSQNPKLKEKLLATGDTPLIEGTYWHDNTWGNCYCDKCKGIDGENRLGQILMRVRYVFASKMDYYLYEENCYKRLEEEFIKYGKLIFCVDFDDTIYDYHKLGRKYDNMIDLLKRWEPYSEVIIFTGNGEEKYPEITKYLDDIGVVFKGINCQSSVQVSGRKIYANVYIDDRGGLPVVYRNLFRLIGAIEKGEISHNV